MKLSFSFIILFMLLRMERSFAVEIYIAPTGSDAPTNGSISAPLKTISYALNRANPGDVIILRSGTYQEIVRIRIPNITIRSHTNEWATIEQPTMDMQQDVTIQFDPEASGGKLQRLEITGGYYYSIFFQTNWEDDNAIPFAKRFGARRVIIEDCKIHDSGRDCIKITPACDSITIRRCEIYNSGKRDNSNAEGIDNVNSDYMIVQDCYIHDIATNGLYAKGGAANCLIERNLIMTCGDGGVLLGYDDTDWEFIDTTANPNAYENIDGVVRNNIISTTMFAGIALWGTQRARVYNNTVIETATIGQAAILITAANHYIDTIPEPRVTPNVDPIIRNNIVVQSFKSIRPIVQIREDGLIGMPMMSNNRYYHINLPLEFDDSRPSTSFNGGFAQWQVHINADTGSSEGDPMLNANIHLASGSPCIDAGFILPAVIDDYDGNVRTGKYDIGADEFGAGRVLIIPPPPGIVGTGNDIPTGVSHTIEPLTTFELYQNYPNPFTEETTIEFRIEEQTSSKQQSRLGESSTEIKSADGGRQSKISLRVFDLFGREVFDLSNAVESIINNRLRQWRTEIVIRKSQLPSPGVYFYRLTSPISSQTKIMMLLK